MEKALLTEKFLTVALSLLGIAVTAFYLVVAPRRFGGKTELSKPKYSWLMVIVAFVISLLSILMWAWFK